VIAEPRADAGKVADGIDAEGPELFGGSEPSGAITHQMPFTAWPATSPAAASEAKLYSGQPSSVS
jgi:hypothetical protein